METTAPNSTTTATNTKTDPVQALVAANPWDRITDVGGYVQLMGKMFSDSGLFGCTPAQGAVIAFNCLVTKTPPLELATTDHIVQGAKPQLTMRADAMLAAFMKRGGKMVWKNQGDDDKGEARAVFTTKDGQKIEIAYSLADATRAGLVKKAGAYEKDPGAQLRARLYSKAIRMLDPEVISGRYCPEDIDPDAVVDYVPVRNEERVAPLNLGKVEPAPVVSSATYSANLAGCDRDGLGRQPGTPGYGEPPAKKAEVPAAPTPTLDAANPMITDGQKKELAELRTKLGIAKDKWTEILAKPKYGVTSALHLTEDKAGMLLAGLRKMAEDKAGMLLAGLRKMAEDKALTEWANKGVAPAVAADTPPFEVPAS